MRLKTILFLMVFITVSLRQRMVTLVTFRTIEQAGGGLIIYLIIPEKTEVKKQRFGVHPDR